jgi:hypothetical protein
MDTIDLLRELTKVDLALAEAVRHHMSRDESNAALHLNNTVLYTPLTQALRGARETTRRLLDGTADGVDPVSTIKGATSHQVRLLGGALGRILVASGVTSDVPMTGPQLLMAAEEHAEWLESNGGVPDYVWRLLDALLNGTTLDFKGAVVPQAVQDRLAKHALPLHERFEEALADATEQGVPETVGAHDASEVARIEQGHEHNAFLCPSHVNGCDCQDKENTVCNPYQDPAHCPDQILVMPQDGNHPDLGIVHDRTLD